jgi:hypothetical protein
VDLGTRFADVSCVAVELKPEILYLGVAEGFEDAAIELVAGGIRRTSGVRSRHHLD